MIVVKRGTDTQLLQLLTRIQRQPERQSGIGATAPGQTLMQKAQPPQPLRRIGAQTEQQRCIFTSEPTQRQCRRTRIGPGLAMTDRDLAAIGKAGLLRHCRLTINELDLMPGLAQVPGGSHADDTGAENRYAHGNKKPGLRRAF